MFINRGLAGNPKEILLIFFDEDLFEYYGMKAGFGEEVDFLDVESFFIAIGDFVAEFAGQVLMIDSDLRILEAA